MKKSRPRLTVRRLMALVALCGLASYLGVTALKVRADPESRMLYHYRESENVTRRELGQPVSWSHGWHSHIAPFWPRYWRQLLGRPWPGTYPCDADHIPSGTGLSATFAGPVSLGIPEVGKKDPVWVRARAEISRRTGQPHPPTRDSPGRARED